MRGPNPPPLRETLRSTELLGLQQVFAIYRIEEKKPRTFPLLGHCSLILSPCSTVPVPPLTLLPSLLLLLHPPPPRPVHA